LVDRSAGVVLEAPVVGWLDQQPAESVWITSLTVLETRFGLALLPKGKRRKALESNFEAFGRMGMDC
jgi:toxin FitB